ncbi:hypothetical protein PM082_013465 [Marasmius tenuissimus]|nr:hypothetical protein PM082_013465 [Marasmius tenuissimus]
MDHGGVTGRDSGSRAGTGRGTTRELYDAFGEVSDDDDTADEETRLRPDRSNEVASGGLGFHSGFLDDEDDPASRGGYRDEPEGSEGQRQRR